MGPIWVAISIRDSVAQLGANRMLFLAVICNPRALIGRWQPIGRALSFSPIGYWLANATTDGLERPAGLAEAPTKGRASPFGALANDWANAGRLARSPVRLSRETTRLGSARLTLDSKNSRPDLKNSRPDALTETRTEPRRHSQTRAKVKGALSSSRKRGPSWRPFCQRVC